MLRTWIDEKRNVQIVHRLVSDNGPGDTPDGFRDMVEIEVAEGFAGLLTIFVRQIHAEQDVVVKFIGPEIVSAENRNLSLAWSDTDAATTREP